MLAIIVRHCDGHGIFSDLGNKGWTKWLPWKLQGPLDAFNFKDSWILSRKRYCKDETGNVACVIEEQQEGYCEDTHLASGSYAIRMKNPICALEKDFERCDIKINS